MRNPLKLNFQYLKLLRKGCCLSPAQTSITSSCRAFLHPFINQSVIEILFYFHLVHAMPPSQRHVLINTIIVHWEKRCR